MTFAEAPVTSFGDCDALSLEMAELNQGQQGRGDAHSGCHRHQRLAQVGHEYGHRALACKRNLDLGRWLQSFRQDELSPDVHSKGGLCARHFRDHADEEPVKAFALANLHLDRNLRRHRQVVRNGALRFLAFS